MTVTEPSARRSGERIDRLAELEEERRFLLRSLTDLDREHEAGDVDDTDYATLKDGYTVRAAAVLRQIEDGRRALAPKRPKRWGMIVAMVVAAALTAGGIGTMLASAWGERGETDQITGFNPANEVRTTLADARAALGQGDLPAANRLFIDADQRELERGTPNAEARAYVGWTYALLARGDAAAPDDERYDLAMLALNQSIEIDDTFADPYCFAAIVENNFREDPEAALPFVDACESNNPPADVAGIIAEFADDIRAATE